MFLLYSSLANYTSTGDPNLQAEYNSKMLFYLNIIGENPEKSNINFLLEVPESLDLLSRAMTALAENEREKSIQYLLRAAIADLEAGNRNALSPSLLMLSNMLFENNDLDHAHKYINFFVEMATRFNCRVAIMLSTQLQNTIVKAYIERTEHYQQRLTINLILLVTFVIIILVALILIIRQMKKIKSMHSEKLLANEALSKANETLEEKNHELETLIENLHEANFVKEEYIGSLFTICSDYITKLDDYRKTVNRKLKVGQIDELRYSTAQTTLIEKELKDFYHNFDKLFLHIFPSFISDLNALLKQDEQIQLKENEYLNTELRIFALIRLGITDIQKIADMLHCSVQTVYNNRQRMYSRTEMNKKDFSAAISILGREKRD